MGVARQLYELHDEAGALQEAARYACLALEAMQGVLKAKVGAG